MAGRPKGEKSFKQMLDIAVKEVAGKKGSKNNLRRIADTLVSKAIEGEGWAVKEVADRLDGKPLQQVEGDISGGLTIIISNEDADCA